MNKTSSGVLKKFYSRRKIMHTKMRKAGFRIIPVPGGHCSVRKCSPHQERQSRVRASYPSLWWHHVKAPLWFHHTQTGKVETFRE